MSGVIIIAIAAFALLGIMLVATLIGDSDDRLTRKYGRLTRDHCEKCGRQLRERERVELTDAAPPGLTEFGFVGGGGISATYCTEDAPT